MANITRRSEIEKNIDILEDDIEQIHPSLLKILLQDKTTRRNILWCTKDYENYGEEYDEHREIKANLITREFFNVIQPRAAKSKKIQERRIKKRAEVFTPSWICNEQNNQVDDAWFGRENVFNTPQGTGWRTKKGKIEFSSDKKTWTDYVDSKRLEVTCGEAPYLVSRYDTTTGVLIPVYERIGIFDRKMRIVNENALNDEEWLKWSIRALKSVYGYEFQGDSVLIARENLLYDYMDFYIDRFKEEPSIELLKKVSNIISWNIWQMDGLKCVVPYSCHAVPKDYQMSLFDVGDEDAKRNMCPCPGCEKNNMFLHTGIYCKIYDWTNLNRSILFIDLLSEEEKHG